LTLSIALKNIQKGCYPAPPSAVKDSEWSDEWGRVVLNQTDASLLYTVAGTGTEVITLNGQSLQMDTGGAGAGDDNSVRTSGFSVKRAPRAIFGETRNTLTLEIIVALTSGITLNEGFTVECKNNFGSFTVRNKLD